MEVKRVVKIKNETKRRGFIQSLKGFFRKTQVGFVFKIFVCGTVGACVWLIVLYVYTTRKQNLLRKKGLLEESRLTGRPRTTANTTKSLSTTSPTFAQNNLQKIFEDGPRYENMSSECHYTVAPLFNIVKLKRRKVSCSTNHIFFSIFEPPVINGPLMSEKEEERRVKIIEEGLVYLHHLATIADLYLITQCQYDQTELDVKLLLDKNAVFSTGLNPSKVLFCSTTMGKAHIARHLDVYMHIDSSEKVATKVKEHIRNVGLITKHRTKKSFLKDRNVYVADSLLHLFG